MDSRVTDLIHVLKSEGLTAADREAAHDFPSVTAASNYTALLRGKLAEMGAILGSVEAHRYRGLSAGRVLLSGLLCTHAQCPSRPLAALTASEVAAYTSRMKVEDMTCSRLLNLISRVKNIVRERQKATALAAYLLSKAA